MGGSLSQFVLGPLGKGMDPDANVAGRAVLLIKGKLKGRKGGKGQNQESVPKAPFPVTKNTACSWTKRPKRKKSPSKISV